MKLDYTLDRDDSGYLVAHCELPNGETWRHVISGRPQNPDRAADCAHVCDMLERDANKRVDEAVTVDPPTESDREGMARAFESAVPLYQAGAGNDPDAVPTN